MRHVVLSGADLPVLERAQLQALMTNFPPRCKRLGETEEEHSRYAGKVELVEALRSVFDENHKTNEEGEPDEFDASNAQRAP